MFLQRYMFEADSGVYGEVGEGVELEVGGRFLSINISNMKLMWISLTMYIKILT